MSTDETTSSAAFYASAQRGHDAVQSLSAIVGELPDTVALSDNPAAALLREQEIWTRISARIRGPGSGAGGDNLCRWLYDTFQGGDPVLQLAVIQFVPAIAGVYLTRALSRLPLAGFEAVLLALYAHETTSRGMQPQTVTIPNLANPSVYHEANKVSGKNKGVDEETNVGILSPALEPHGTVRSTRRARIVGVALELYYSKIALMPISSKLDFCEYCISWSGQERILEDEVSEDTDIAREEDSGGEKGGRIPLPWELFQPSMRILGHCLMGPHRSTELKAAAYDAVKCMHARAMHEMNPQAILVSRSLVQLGKPAAQERIPELSMLTPSLESRSETENNYD